LHVGFLASTAIRRVNLAALANCRADDMINRVKAEKAKRQTQDRGTAGARQRQVTVAVGCGQRNRTIMRKPMLSANDVMNSKGRDLSQSWFSLAQWVILVLPFAVYLLWVIRYAVNVPYLDDYGSILFSLSEFFKADNLVSKLGVLFRQHNEHRLAFDRVIAIIHYWLLGRVDFRNLIIFGNLGWVLGVGTLIYRARRRLGLSVFYCLPIPFILFAFTHWEIMFFATPSLQFYWVVLFSILFLHSLVDNRVYRAALLFPLALFTSGSGIVLYPLGVVYLLAVRRWKALGVFSVTSSIFVLMYLYGYHSKPTHPDIISALINLEQTTTYFFAFLGGMFGSEYLAGLLGFSFFIILTLLFIIGVRDHFLVLVASWLLLTGALTSLTRSGFGVEQAVASRYSVNSLLTLVCIYLWLHISSKEKKDEIAYVFFAMGLLLFCGSLLKQELHNEFARQKAERINGLAAFIQGDRSRLAYPNPEEAEGYLLRAESLGIYSYRNVEPYDKPEELDVQSIKSNSLAQGFIDTYTAAYIAGWILIPNVSSAASRTSILLIGNDKVYKVASFRVNRPDVSKAFNTQFMYDGAGFEVYLAAYRISPGSYKVSLVVENGDQTAVADAAQLGVQKSTLIIP
jgi:hypothetical protein